MRVVQPRGTRGSLKWLQSAVAGSPQILQPPGLSPITWVSPLEEDDHAEYRDEAFLQRLGLGHLAGELKDYWPQRGPQWDALGLTSNGPVLVEAKAYIGEFFSPATQAGPGSLARIEEAFRAVGTDLGVGQTSVWTSIYYQYANRLAFLWWLRKQGVDAKLLFVSFLHDQEMAGPHHSETWNAAFASADYALGLPGRHRLKRHILHVMPDVRELPQ